MRRYYNRKSQSFARVQSGLTSERGIPEWLRHKEEFEFPRAKARQDYGTFETSLDTFDRPTNWPDGRDDE